MRSTAVRTSAFGEGAKCEMESVFCAMDQTQNRYQSGERVFKKASLMGCDWDFFFILLIHIGRINN